MSASFHNQDIFEMRAERVAINGYRLTMAGYELGDSACWDEFWTRLVDDAGLTAACDLAGAIHHFIRCLRSSTQRSLQYFPRDCRRACTDECIILSLISASQNCDGIAFQTCIDALTVNDTAELQGAAHMLSERLSASGLHLMPVPLAVVTDIIGKSCASCSKAQRCLN
jgi:hypothetical protein